MHTIFFMDHIFDTAIRLNFFINHNATRAEDIRALIELVMKTVKEKHGVDLELEVELVGDW